MKKILFSLAILGLLLPLAGLAKMSEPFSSKAVNASLIMAQDGIANGSATLSGGFSVILAEGWKTYWRTPGEVGLAPEIDWSESENIRDVQFLWPAPSRFHAFGIENFGYKNEVVFPLNIQLAEPGKPAVLRGHVQMLTCSIVCVPQDFILTLEIGAGNGIDTQSAELIAKWAKRIPLDGEVAGVSMDDAALDTGTDPAIVIVLRSRTPFKSPDVFPEISTKTTFGPPDIRMGNAGRLLWARIPLTSLEDGAKHVSVTVTDGGRAVTLAAMPFTEPVPAPPYEISKSVPGLLQLLKMAGIALLGGLILNAMPCVLPVLSIKLSSAMRVQGKGNMRIRTGFLVSAAGVLAFMWGLAAIIVLLRKLGLTVGWGLQFQNPIFLTAMTALMFLFAANLFGVFEIQFPAAWSTRLSRNSGQSGFLGDFSTGAFAAVLATPCSAPFLGTAVAFALTGRGIDIFVIFSALGLGLATPYLLVAARPNLVELLPKPGRWMLAMKGVLALLLALTAFWMLWVLNSVAGRDVAFAVTAILVLAVAALALRLPERRPSATIRRGLVPALIVAALAVPVAIGVEEKASAGVVAESQKIGWVGFKRADIAKRVSEGKVVFVDVTADWCLTCKANKALVLDRGEVARILNGAAVVAMQADWTRPDTKIARFLEDNGRYGIPFNAVYGPFSPDGIILPEVLTQDLVIDALRKAGGESAVRTRQAEGL